MKPLSISLVLFGLLALVQPAHQLDLPGALLGIVVLLCAATTFRSSDISSFLKIFVGIFSTETIVFGLAVLAGRTGLWPADYAEYLPPESLPLTVAIFSIIVYVVAQFGVVGQIMRIADRYFNADEVHSLRVRPFGQFTALERRLGVAMVVFLVLINQAQVGIIVRLNFFNRDLFVQCHSKPRCSYILASAAVCLHAFCFCVRGDDGHRILYAVDARHPLAAMVDRSFRVALAGAP
jgi:vitamin B12/bleomycin/antimicrobial peptide transport system ATP-binding/permease protein